MMNQQRIESAERSDQRHTRRAFLVGIVGTAGLATAGTATARRLAASAPQYIGVYSQKIDAAQFDVESTVHIRGRGQVVVTVIATNTSGRTISPTVTVQLLDATDAILAEESVVAADISSGETWTDSIQFTGTDIVEAFNAVDVLVAHD